MTDNRPGGAGPAVEYTYGERNAILAFLQRPRILLLLLAGWSVIGVLSEVFTESDLFSNVQDIDGVLAGMAMGWSGVALAALYIYCFRNPERYPRIFWLALVQLGALCLSILYHWTTGPLSVESVIVPLAISGFLLFLVFVNLFGEDETPETADQAPTR